jgi:hypothetical protein
MPAFATARSIRSKENSPYVTIVDSTLFERSKLCSSHGSFGGVLLGPSS